MIPEAAVEAAARGMAIHDDDDGCFLEVDAWNEYEEWEREAYPENYPGSSIEDCAYWIAKARAALKAAAPHMLVGVWDEGYTTGNAHNERRDDNPYRLNP